MKHLLLIFCCIIFSGVVFGQEATVEKSNDTNQGAVSNDNPALFNKMLSDNTEVEATEEEGETAKKVKKKETAKAIEKSTKNKKENKKAEVTKVEKTKITKGKEKDIHKLLKITGSEKLAQENFKLMLRQLKLAFYQVPSEFWEGFEKKADMNQISNLIVPIYAKHFTQEEIQGLIAFYDTPLGKKMITKMPIIQQESMKAGQKWGEDLSKKVLKEIEINGYD